MESFDTIEGRDAHYGDRAFRVARFWVVMTAKVQRIDFVEQVAQLDVESKWFWCDPDFLGKIRRGEIRLSGLEEAATETALRLQDGHRVYGAYVSGDLRAFPVNPDKIFANQVGGLTHLSDPWVRYEEMDHLVSVQRVFQTVVTVVDDLKNYPLDAVVVPLHLSVRQAPHINRRLTWQLDSHLVGVVERHDFFPEDAQAINMRLSPRTSHLAFSTPRVAHVEYTNKPWRPVLCLVCERHLTSFLVNYLLPLFIIVSGSLGVFFAERANHGWRLSTMLSGMLMLSAYKTSILNTLPTTAHVTLAEKYIVSCFVFLLVAVVKTLATVQITGDGSGLFQSGNAKCFFTSTSNTSHPLGAHMDCVAVDGKPRVRFDDGTSWFLAATWVLLNFGFVWRFRPHRLPKPEETRLGTTWDDVVHTALNRVERGIVYGRAFIAPF